MTSIEHTQTASQTPTSARTQDIQEQLNLKVLINDYKPLKINANALRSTECEECRSPSILRSERSDSNSIISVSPSTLTDPPLQDLSENQSPVRNRLGRFVDQDSSSKSLSEEKSSNDLLTKRAGLRRLTSSFSILPVANGQTPMQESLPVSDVPAKKFKSWQDFKQCKLIAEGAIGKVYRAYYSDLALNESDSGDASPRSDASKKFTIYAVKVFRHRNVSHPQTLTPIRRNPRLKQKFATKQRCSRPSTTLVW
jgi:hypothetical protein